LADSFNLLSCADPSSAVRGHAADAGQFQADRRGDRGALPFLAWLVPTIGKFPKSHQFTIGDRIETVALVLEALIAPVTPRAARRGGA
jgi:hypothetical protein